MTTLDSSDCVVCGQEAKTNFVTRTVAKEWKFDRYHVRCYEFVQNAVADAVHRYASSGRHPEDKN